MLSRLALRAWISASFAAAVLCSSLTSLASASWEAALLSCFACSSWFARVSRSFSMVFRASAMASFWATSFVSSFAFNSWISASLDATVLCDSLANLVSASSIALRLSTSASSSRSCSCCSNSLVRTCFRISEYAASSILNAFPQCGQMISCMSIALSFSSESDWVRHRGINQSIVNIVN